MDWSPWSECSATCGSNGERYRFRTCVNGDPGDGSCTGNDREDQTCNNVVSTKYSFCFAFFSCCQTISAATFDIETMNLNVWPANGVHSGQKLTSPPKKDTSPKPVAAISH